MALEGKTNFKTNFVAGTRSTASRMGVEGHANIHSSIGSVLNNLQDDVGIDGSSDTNSLKYKVDNTANASKIKSKDVATPSVNGQYLMYNSSTDDLEWDTPAGAGDMLRSVYDPAAINEQLVGLTATQTLTNKRLTSPKINEDVAITATATELNVLDGIPPTLTATELGYVDGVTSSIQDQLNGKASSGANSDITSLSGLTTPLTVAQGGTGVATLTGIVKADGTNNFSGVTAPSGTIVGTTDTQELSNKTHDGDLKLKNATDNITVNNADPWRTISITPGFLKPTTTAGCADVETIEAGTNDIDYDVLAFDASTAESAFCNLQMPDSWDGGAIQFRFIWTAASGGSNQQVYFNLGGRSYGDDDAIDQVVNSFTTNTDTWIANGDIHISDWSINTTLLGTPAGGEWVHLEIYRDTNSDDLTGDARLIGLQIRYKQAQYSD